MVRIPDTKVIIYVLLSNFANFTIMTQDLKKENFKNHRQFIRTCFFISLKFYPPPFWKTVYMLSLCYTDIVLHCLQEHLLCSVWLFTDFKSWTSVTRPMCSATRGKRNSGRMPSEKVYLSRANTGRSVSPSNWLIICIYTTGPFWP